MSFMKCPRCGLSVGLRVQYLTLEHCPRCVAKSGISVPMQITEGEPPAESDGPRSEGRRALRGKSRERAL